MAIIKCKMCGGDVVLSEDKTFGTCDHCGSTMTFPKVSDDQRAAAFNRGNHFRRMGEFDKALAVYERIVAEDDNDAEAHWCCALCRFGIEYVEDPATYEWLPTCHRASFDSFLEDVDYLAALEHSDGITRRQYQKDAAKIAEVQRGILATSQNAEPYDVFISYKELDADGNRTRDSILAQDIYYQLTEKGWRVFFSRISLEDVPGTQYEPYIFAALNSAKVMVVVGTSAENLNAVWVKNEWSRYLSLMRKDRSKLLLPCYRDMDPYDLPEQLSVLMSYDMGKIGFIQDLIRGIDKVLSADKPKETTASTPVQQVVQQTVVQQSGGGPNIIALLKRGQQALEDGDWSKAKSFYDQVLSMDAENADAFIGLALAGQQSRDLKAYIDSLCSGRVNVETDTLPRDKAHIESSIAKAVVPGYCDGKELASLYDYVVAYPVKLREETAVTQQIRSRFNGDRNLSRAFRYAQGETKQMLDTLKKDLFDTLDKRVRAAEISDKKALEEAKAEYTAKMEDADRKAEELSCAAQEKREADYQVACRKADEATESFEYQDASVAFKRVGKFKDAAIRAKECEQKATEIKERQEQAKQAEKEKAEKAKKKKKTIIGIVFAALAVATIVFLILLTSVIIPNKDYQKAEKMYLQGQKAQALLAFRKMGDYRDSRERCLAIWDEIAVRNSFSEGYQSMIYMTDEGVIYNGSLLSDWTNVISVSDGAFPTVALKSDGTVYLLEDASYDNSKVCNVSGWSDIVSVSAGWRHVVGLKSDGTVVATGDNDKGECNVSGWSDIIAVDAGWSHTVGLKADGTVIAVGSNYKNKTSVSDWTNIVSIAAGYDHTVGLRADGTVVAVGNNDKGCCNVSTWKDIIAISAGKDITMGLKSDGTVVYAGKSYINADLDGINSWTDIVAISAGSDCSGLKENGELVYQNGYIICSDVKVPDR